jgi:uncharacterized protein YwgA
MRETTRVAIRMRDVGLALRAAGDFGQALNRIRLQKFIYLVDAASRIFDIVPIRVGHITYKHGPYDRFIQNAVDSLAFRGFVNIIRLQEDESGNLQTEYSLSDPGVRWTTKLKENQAIESQWNLVHSVSMHVNSLGWQRLRKLVYAEPTFLSTKGAGYGQHLRTDDASSSSANSLIQLAQAAITSGFAKKELSADKLLTIFFRFLDQYASMDALR